MVVFGVLSVTLALLCASAHSAKINLFQQPTISAYLEENPYGGLNLFVTKDSRTEVLTVIGRKAGKIKDFVSDGDVVIQFEQDVSVRISTQSIGGRGQTITVKWEAPRNVRLEDCVNLNLESYGNDAIGYVQVHREGKLCTVKAQITPEHKVKSKPYCTFVCNEESEYIMSVCCEDCVASRQRACNKNWYGGPQQKRQYWPIEKLVLPDYSYISKEADNCGIAEPYWLNSDGMFFYFDKKVPLFVDQNDLEKNAACFIAQIKPPYSSRRESNQLSYTIGILQDARRAHQYAVEKFLGKPTGYPDERMIRDPIWSTWAKYKRDIDHDIVLNFAKDILENRFNNSQLEIDDLWEICYGSLTVDEIRFPDLRQTTNMLKQLGFRVTMWIHPFINKGCEPWYSEALQKGYLVKSEYGSVETSWWNDNETTTANVDFTKPEARKWWLDKLINIQERYGIDNFKFDAGESSWSPQIPVLEGDINDQPSQITIDYVTAVAQFGDMVEVRAGQRTQSLPIFVRMIDKDTYWTFENGLPTLVTTLLQMNMNGYPLVLPDMIGGNGYNEPPDKELFIRWLQANVFMPALQYSYVPWDFDRETIEISHKFTDLHAKFTPDIVAAMQSAVKDGSPVNPPIWWIAPDDVTAQGIWDEFLLGERILAAPVLEKYARSRDVYLPEGKWMAQGNPNDIVEGGEWIRNYPAPLDTLPYFIKID